GACRNRDLDPLRPLPAPLGEEHTLSVVVVVDVASDRRAVAHRRTGEPGEAEERGRRTPVVLFTRRVRGELQALALCRPLPSALAEHPRIDAVRASAGLLPLVAT